MNRPSFTSGACSRGHWSNRPQRGLQDRSAPDTAGRPGKVRSAGAQASTRRRGRLAWTTPRTTRWSEDSGVDDGRQLGRSPSVTGSHGRSAQSRTGRRGRHHARWNEGAARYRKPERSPDPRVSHRGGSETFATDSARFLIECWDPSELAAEQLVNKVRRLLKQCRGQRFAGAFIHGSKATSLPVNFPDPGTSSARFQFTGELTIGLL